MKLFKGWTPKQKWNLIIGWAGYMIGIWAFALAAHDWRIALCGVLSLLSFNLLLTLYLLNRPK